ncbi:hypothetical protein J008_05214 [Cryptococcus neoformans]|nr:hypothetical protein J008_05214 [Cryptococcus neoformans var. grubii]
MNDARHQQEAVLNAHITPFTQLPETVRAELMDSTCPGAVISVSFSMDWNLDADSGCMANPALGGGSLLDVSAYPSLWAMLLLHRHPLNTDKRRTPRYSSLIKQFILVLKPAYDTSRHNNDCQIFQFLSFPRLAQPFVNGAIIEIEPPTLSGQRRNDLRIRGTSSLPFADYDLKVLSLGDNKARSTAVPHPPNSKLADFCFDRCVGWLDKVGKAVEKRAPRVAGGVFKPLILSTGGFTSHETADEHKAWREAMPEGVPSPTEED